MKHIPIILSLFCSTLHVAGSAAAPLTVGARASGRCGTLPVLGAMYSAAAPRVQAKPKRQSTVLGQLLSAQDPEEETDLGLYVEVIDLKKDWARIAPTEVPLPDGSVRKIPGGWIESRHLHFTMQTYIGFAAPDAKSARAYEGHDWIERDSVLHLIACQGEWMKLQIKGEDGKRHTGWFRGACAIVETSCDGVGGDYPLRTVDEDG